MTARRGKLQHNRRTRKSVGVSPALWREQLYEALRRRLYNTTRAGYLGVAAGTWHMLVVSTRRPPPGVMQGAADLLWHHVRRRDIYQRAPSPRGLTCVVVWAWGPEAPSLRRALDAAYRLGSKPPELWGEVLPTMLAAQPPGSWRMLHRGGAP